MKALGALVAMAGVANADTPIDRPEAIEVDRDVPPPGRVELGFDAGAPVGAWAADVQLGYLDRPLVLRGQTVTIVPVDHRETVALGGAVALGSSLVADARLPIVHQLGDRFMGGGDDRGLQRWTFGELALGVRLRVASPVFLRASLTLPTGNDYEFSGEPTWSAAWLLIGRAPLGHGIVVAATGGIRLRGAEVVVADRTIGDELDFGVGATVEIPPIAGLWCVPEQLKLAGELVGAVGDHVGGQRGPSPVEARLGVIGQPRPGVVVGVRAGVGLDDQIGAPRFRAMLEVAWQAPAPPPSTLPPREPVPDPDEDASQSPNGQ